MWRWRPSKRGPDPKKEGSEGLKKFRTPQMVPPCWSPLKGDWDPITLKDIVYVLGISCFFVFFGGLSDLYPNDTTSWHDCLGRHPKAGGCWTPNRLTPNIRGNLSRIYEPIGSNRCFQSLPLRLCGGWMMMMFFLFINPAQSTMDLSLEVACCLHFPPGVIASKMKRCWSKASWILEAPTRSRDSEKRTVGGSFGG